MRYSQPYHKRELSDGIQSIESHSDTDFDSGVKPINPRKSSRGGGGFTIDSY